MSKKKRVFDTTFKLDVARMVRDQGMSISDVCRTTKIGETAVRRWVARLDADRAAGAGAGSKLGIGKPLTEEQRRIRELELENRKLKSDNELLKKVSAYFAKEIA
jgi:transposase